MTEIEKTAMPDEPVKLDLLALYGRARALAENGFWQELETEEFDELREKFPRRFGALILTGIRTELGDLDNFARLFRQEADKLHIMAANENELFAQADRVVKKYFGSIQDDGHDHPLFFYISSEERLTLDSAMVLGLPDEINSRNIVSLSRISETDLVKFKLRAAINNLNFWHDLKNQLKTPLQTNGNDKSWERSRVMIEKQIEIAQSKIRELTNRIENG